MAKKVRRVTGSNVQPVMPGTNRRREAREQGTVPRRETTRLQASCVRDMSPSRNACAERVCVVHRPVWLPYSIAVDAVSRRSH